MSNIGSVCARTGISASTIRSWELRYGLISPVRTPTGRRIYSDEDVEKIVLIRKLTEIGYAPSLLAEMNVVEMRNIIAESSPKADSRDIIDLDGFRRTITERDATAFEMLLDVAIYTKNPLSLVEEILCPILIYVGELWSEKKIDIGFEHEISEIIRSKISHKISALASIATREKIIFSTVAGERHEFGALFACLIAASEKFRCVYIGADIPSEDLAEATMRHAASILVLAYREPSNNTIDYLKKLRSYLPHQVDLVFGGGVLGLQKSKLLPTHVVQCNSFADFARFLGPERSYGTK